jgi:hypothetical protein
MRTTVILALLALGCQTPRRAFEDHLVDTLPEGMSANSFRFSRDGRIAAYVRFDRPEDRVVVNRIPGKALSLI